ncbi:MAG: hypothetical protein QG657_4385, partial [Acidobacteriota bacterium]|nr:hypothetical protein [Acidobacteriota bacterium]
IIVNCQLLIFNCKRMSPPQVPFHHSSFIVHHSSQLAYIIYTSGSTGKSKGVMVEHRGVVNYAVWRIAAYGFTPDDVTLQMLSYCFDGFGSNFYSSLLSGGRLVVVPDSRRLDYFYINQTIKEKKVTNTSLTPGIYEGLLDSVLGDDLQTLRFVVFGGDKSKPGLIEKSKAIASHVSIINEYGPTETTIAAAFNLNFDFDPANTSVIGKPPDNTRLYIYDPNLHPVPINIGGELYISGVGVARGYLNNPELTANKFIDFHQSSIINHHSKLYRTGDLARWLPDGNIEFLGRIDNQVKIRGFRVELGEIENVLLKHGRIKDTVVVLKTDETGDKSLIGYFVSDMELSDAELSEYLLKTLPGYMIPSGFVQLGKIPLTSTGKVDRGALPKPGLKVGENYTAPRNEIEKTLVQLWAEILGRGPLHSSQLQTSIGIADDFFQLGGHSLKATILVSKIHKAFDVIVPLTEIFKTPRIKELARYIKEKSKEFHISIEPVEKKEYYLLSSAQKRLFALQHMNPDCTAYNMPEIVPLPEESDLGKVEEVFKKLVKRHESLRTSFQLVNDTPVQVIHDEVEFQIECDYLATEVTGDTGDTGGEIHHSSFMSTPNHFNHSFIRPFDLSLPPLMRISLITQSDGSYIMFVDIHHIIADGVSCEILIKDFLAMLFEEKELPPLRLQYKDFSEWQNSDERERKILKHQEEYWLKEFKGEIPVLDLPNDYPRPQIQSFEGNKVTFEISSEETRGLTAVALKEKVTLFMVLAAVFNILLSKLSNQEEIIIGTPIAGRRHADLEKIIGMFVNTLALRNYPLGYRTVREFLGDVKERSLMVFENQEFPFEELVDKLSVKRDIGRNPLFDIMFVLQNMNTGSEDQDKEIELETSRLVKPALPKEYENIVQTVKFDLTLTAIERNHGLLLLFQYCTKLFKKETVERFIIYFKKIAAQVIKDPGIRLSEIEIVTEEEKKRILSDFNRTEAVYPKDKTIHQLFEKQVERTPDHIALVGAGPRACPNCLTYRQLDMQSNYLAGVLIGKGVLADNIIGIMMERSIEMIIGILGILKSNGAYLPIDPEYPQERIDYMLKDSGAKILINEKFFGGARGAVLQKSPPCSANLAYIIYTSGTTGKPKGVLVEHRNAVNTVNWFVEIHKVGVDTHIIQLSDYTFDASVNQVFGSLISGASLYIATKVIRTDIKKLRDYIIHHRINVINFVPTLLKELLCDIDKLTSLHTVISGAEKLEENTKEAIIGRGYRLVNQYGPTETTIDALALECSSGQVSLGKPIFNVKVYIMDKYEKIVPMGVVGELYIAGDGVARGYLNRPELTRGSFKKPPACTDPAKLLLCYPLPLTTHHSPFYHTGDLARWLPDGNLEFLGRIDNQVKIRGYRIELGEIENRLLKIIGVKEAAVLARKDDGGNKYLCSYIVSDKKFEISEIRESLAKELPDYMIPSYFVQMEKMPLTSNSKVDRSALPSPEGISISEDVGYTLPSSAVEKKLVEIWEHVLGRNNIGINENFFMIGGDSIKSIQIVSRMNSAGYKLEMRDIFQYPVISVLAAHVKKLKRSQDQTVITGTIPLTPIQEMFFNRSLTGAHHYNQSVMFYSRARLDKEEIKVIFTKIHMHHDALRMTYETDWENRKVIQIDHGANYPLSLEEYEINGPTDNLELLAEKMQASIDLGKGPLMKLGLFHLNDGDRLLIVIHHLVIDGVSWRILFEDIETLYGQYRRGQKLVLPPKTDSFKLWSEKLSAFANSKTFLKEKTYWQKIESAEPLPLPKDFEVHDNYIKDTGSVSFTLEEAETERLLTKINKAFGTEINDILLTALGISIKRTFGQDLLAIALEGHGREEILEGIDISRTVGWFTGLFPVLMDISDAGDPGRQLKKIKETLRGIPNKGIGYGILKYLTHEENKKEIEFKLKPQISFNYLGQFDADVKQIASFEIAKEAAGNSQNPNNRREYLLDVSGITTNNRLAMTILFNKTHFTPETMVALAENFESGLRDLIAFCDSEETGEQIPADFTDKGLTSANSIKFKKYVDEPMALLNQPGQKKLFFFPPLIGFGIAYQSLANVINDYSIYSFNFIEDENRLEEYVEIITKVQMTGPYILFGWSAPGKLIFEVTRILEYRNLEVSDIILADNLFFKNSAIGGEGLDEFMLDVRKYLEREGVESITEKVRKKVEDYSNYLRNTTTLQVIQANVHLILSEDTQNNSEADIRCWDQLTTKPVLI